MLGTVVDSKYQIVSCLGQGGMGAVYEARHLGTGRRVALKMIIPASLAAGGDVIPRFRREARASGAIDSEHVVQVLDTGVDPQTSSPYLVMECLTGEDLQQLVRRVGPLTPEVVLRMMAQACAGLSRAHQTGTIHRDIKSANLFVSRRESGEVTIKILDFGIAKVRADPMSASANEGITRTGALLGSPLYMSPEHVLGSKDIDHRSDVFSLGATMYEALCGVTPHHDCETVGLLIVAITSGRMKHVQERAPWVASEVAAIVHKALAFEASARFQTAAEMLAAIMALLPQGPSIHESMLEGVSPERKSLVSPKVAQLTAPLKTPVPMPSLTPSAMATSFTDASLDQIPKRPAWHLLVPVVAFLALVAVGLALYTQRNRDVDTARSSAPAPLLSSPAGAANSVSSASSGSVQSEAPPPPATASAAMSGTKLDVDAAVRLAPSPSQRPRPPVVMANAAPSAAGATARPSCDPPYTFNGEGKKIWKRECL